MSVILAAIDDSAVARPVLRSAVTMARTLGAEPHAMHVREAGHDDAPTMAREADVTFEVVEGDPVDRILEASAAPDAEMLVIGSRGEREGRRPSGHVARAVMAQVHKPLLVVPPEALLLPEGFRHALVPLEGSAATSDAVIEHLRAFGRAGVELTAVHVFDSSRVPRFWDQSGHAEESWGTEFLARWCEQPQVRLHLRTGDVAGAVLDVGVLQDVDLILLGWGQDMSGDRARVVRDILSHAHVPLLLVPAPR